MKLIFSLLLVTKKILMTYLEIIKTKKINILKIYQTNKKQTLIEKKK